MDDHQKPGRLDDGFDIPGAIDPEAPEHREQFKQWLGAKDEDDDGAGAESEALPYSDEALALLFASRHADELRHCEGLGRWLAWHDGCWREDDRRHVFSLARGLCREQSNHLRDTAEEPEKVIRLARHVASAKTVAAVVNLARADQRLATTLDQWDADPWLLATPGGVVDLRTGVVRPAKPDDLMTRQTAVAPASPGTDCPLWLAFLDRVTAGDREFRAYLQRLIGYSLTGLTTEQMLAFLYGTGANGKGVFLNTVTEVLGGYARTAPAETFEASTGDKHPTELARLRGARFVASQETEQNKRWAEARIKSLTGGDVIAARFMRGDFFEFRPQFKLLIAGNHKPGLKSVDEAIRRRLHLVPFTVTIPPQERDPALFEKLKAEWPAILRWAIEGCLAWQKDGLNPPGAVASASEEYFAECDLIGEWLRERTEHGNDSEREDSADLYADWKVWAERAGERAGTQKAFSMELKKRGFEPKREAGTGLAGFRGIRLKRTDYSEDRRYGV